MKIKVFVFNPFYENTYVVYDETTREAAIIDCGCLGVDEETRLKNFVDEEKLSIKYLLNTHLHLDHQFGNHFAVATWGVLPSAHEGDRYWENAFETQCMLFGIPQEVHNQSLGTMLREGDELTIGNFKLTVLHVPGHSAGSICFYNKKANVLFSGDALFRESIGRTDLPGGNHPQLIEGIKTKILTMCDETIVYTGHGESTTVEHERYNNPYL
ncbi:MAG: MBL fold metallo-hydrolase [Bacteroidales bacterium]|nr:MBL fold metallo-hydrolase [Bacteroidales bacterium]